MAAWDNDTEKVRWCLWLDRSLANARQDSIVSGEPGTHILYVAALRGSAGMIRLLLDSGADVNARSIRNVPPLHVAAMYRDLEIVSLLVERGADVNARTRSGGTALVAVRDTRPEIAELLRHHGATEPEHEPEDAPAPEAEEVTTEKGM